MADYARLLLEDLLDLKHIFLEQENSLIFESIKRRQMALLSSILPGKIFHTLLISYLFSYRQA